jgi:5'-deoxynucleotidase YfbR-like HD superfamily hydrolase
VIFDFSFQEVMRLSSIKRWGIIEMSRQQSVAEHSFNVAVISHYLITEIQDVAISYAMHSQIMLLALTHDLTELVTGDLPTPMKQFVGKAIDEMEQSYFPKLIDFKGQTSTLIQRIVKIADTIDAIQFAKKFCVDSRREAIIGEMVTRLEGIIRITEEKENVLVAQAVENLWNEERTS